LTVAFVSVLANILVVGVHALDGSDDTEHLTGLGRRIRRPLAKHNRDLEAAAKQEAVIERTGRHILRVTTKAVVDASRYPAAADQAVDAARATHQGCGPYAQAAADPNGTDDVVGYRCPPGRPTVDLRAIRQLLGHVDTPFSDVESAPSETEDPGES
jgi:hypothetical protein